MRGELILIAVFACISGITSQVPITARCRQYFTASGDTCYHFSTVEKGWTEAYFKCQDIGGNLVAIESQEEQQTLENIIKNDNEKSVKSGWWIGGSDLVQEGDWQWMSNSPRYIDYSNWYPGEPNTVVNPENCLMMYNLWGYKWADRFCCDKFNYICESKPVTNTNPYTYY